MEEIIRSMETLRIDTASNRRQQSKRIKILYPCYYNQDTITDVDK